MEKKFIDLKKYKETKEEERKIEKTKEEEKDALIKRLEQREKAPFKGSIEIDTTEEKLLILVKKMEEEGIKYKIKN